MSYRGWLLVVALVVSPVGYGAHPVPADAWQPVAAESLGWDADALAAAKGYYDSLESAALMVVHRGQPVVSWGAVADKHYVASVRKSLLNALYGVYWDRGVVRLDKTLAEIGIQDSDPALTDAERQATVEHLLLSRSGVYHSALYDAGWAQYMPEPGSKAPGEYWIYNNWDFNALGTIFERETGMSIHAAFATEMAAPLGLQDFDASDVEYQDRSNLAERMMGNASDHGLYLFRISTRDLARFGLLYLNAGQWGERQVLSKAWVERSMQGVPTEYTYGNGRLDTRYGYLWWVDEGVKRRLNFTDFEDKVIIASGSRGQFLLIIPSYDLVIAHTTAIRAGASTWAQVTRRVFGAPSVSDEQFERLVILILAAHPDRG